MQEEVPFEQISMEQLEFFRCTEARRALQDGGTAVQRHRPSENAARSEIGVQIMSERETEPGETSKGKIRNQFRFYLWKNRGDLESFIREI